MSHGPLRGGQRPGPQFLLVKPHPQQERTRMPQFPSYKDYQVYEVLNGDLIHRAGYAPGWYFDEGTQSVGPYLTEEIARRICALRRNEAEMAARRSEIDKLPYLASRAEMERTIKCLQLTDDEAKRVRQLRADFTKELPPLPKGAKPAYPTRADTAAQLSRKLLIDVAIDAVKALPRDLREEFEKILTTIEPCAGG
jgi:hypothetical protein